MSDPDLSTPEVSSPNERRTIYIVCAIIFGVLILVALLAYRSAESNEQAEEKANQLIAALEQAGARAPSQEQIVRVLGDDGGALCDDPDQALRRSILYSQLVNGAGGPGMRPIIADSRVVQGQLLVIGIYCPDELPGFQEVVDNLKFDDVAED
jgi:hypothetical protein